MLLDPDVRNRSDTGKYRRFAEQRFNKCGGGVGHALAKLLRADFSIIAPPSGVPAVTRR